MANLSKSYTDAVYDGLRYVPTWEPSTAIAVGDVAKIEDLAYVCQRTLSDLGVPVKQREGKVVKHRGWASHGALKLAGGGKATGRGKSASTRVEFDAKHAVLFRAERSVELRLDRPDQAEKAVMQLHEQGEWDLDWIYVTHVVRAATFTVLISDGRGASADLTVTGGLGTDAARLASGNVGVKVNATEGLAYELIDVKGATPLYRALRLQRRRGPGRSDRVKRTGPRGRIAPEPGAFELVEVIL